MKMGIKTIKTRIKILLSICKNSAFYDLYNNPFIFHPSKKYNPLNVRHK